jgi:hypothetical protein
LTIKIFHDAFGSATGFVPWICGAGFLLLFGLLFRWQRECCAAAETGRAQGPEKIMLKKPRI